MNLSTLKPAKGSTKTSKRIGRGQGSGMGGTSTRGHKGAQSRSGYSKKRGFEGGQMPLQRRIPKFGFNNASKVVSKPINLDVLQTVIDTYKLTAVTPEIFVEHGLASKKDTIKVLGRGELKSKVEVSAHSFSKGAQEAIEKNGGKVTVL